MTLWCKAAILTIFAVVFVKASNDVMPPKYHCMLACPDDQMLDTRGCRCVDIPILSCLKACPSGQVLDPKTCTCSGDGPVKPDCPPHICPLREELPCQVYNKDDKGCPICTCKCYKFTICPHNCEYGVDRGTDKDGCPTCNCKPKTCPPLCRMRCPYGNVLDNNGCAICKCKPPPSRKDCGPICAMYCPFGFEQDARGCPLCRCKSGSIFPPYNN